MRQPSHEGGIRRADKTLLDELRAAVAAEQVLTEGDLSAWEVDWRRRYRGRALCVVRPGDTLEVAAVVRACARHGATTRPMTPLKTTMMVVPGR